LRIPSTKARVKLELLEYYKDDQASMDRFMEELKEVEKVNGR